MKKGKRRKKIFSKLLAYSIKMLTLTKGLLNQYGRKIEERKRRKKNFTKLLVYYISTFEIYLGSQQMPRVLPRHIYVF